MVSAQSCSITGLDTVYCDVNDIIPLTLTPSGGILSGSGVIDTTFNPEVAGSGIHTLSYFNYEVAQNTTGYAPEAFSDDSTLLTLGNEAVSLAIPLGFTFKFYDIPYSRVYISSNGWLSFSPQSTAAPTPQSIPDNNNPNNLIAFAWDDLDPRERAGSIYYDQIGTAPSRKFVLQFDRVDHDGGSLRKVTTQVVLNEGSNIIEFHSEKIQSKNILFNNNITQGLENATGAVATVVPGRNNAEWNVNEPEYISFTPCKITREVTVYKSDYDFSLNVTAASPILCAGESTDIILENSEEDVSYILYQIAADQVIGSVVRGTGADIHFPTGPLAATDSFLIVVNPYPYTCQWILEDVVTVTVNASNFTADLTSSAVDNTICDGEHVTFTANVTSGTPGAPVSYEFFLNDVSQNTPSVTNTFSSNTLSDGDRVHVVVREPGTCEAIAPAITTTVHNRPSMLPVVTMSNFTVCTGETVEVTLSPSEPGVNYTLRDNTTAAISTLVAGTGSDLIISTSILNHLQTGIMVVATNPSTGCISDFPSQPLTVHALPAVPVITSTGSTTCDTTDPDVTLTGSAAPNSGKYTWYKEGIPTGDTTQSIIINSPVNSGDYAVTVTDGATLCESMLSAMETVIIHPSVSVSAVTSDITCFGFSDGTVTGMADGGTGTLTYDLEDGIGMPVANTGGDATGSYTGLPAGTYRLRVTDTNGCEAVSSNVIVSEPGALLATTTVSNYNESNISCAGQSDGFIEVTAAGGTGNYTFMLGGAATAVQTQLSNQYRFSGLPAGIYHVSVSDGNGCNMASAITINLKEPLPLSAAGSVTSDYNGAAISCYGSADGEITISASGGSGSYTYVLNDVPDFFLPPPPPDDDPGEMVAYPEGVYGGLPSSSYTASATDANGCKATTSIITINSPPPLTNSATENVTLSCIGDHTGEGSFTAYGGTAPYSFYIVENTAGANTFQSTPEILHFAEAGAGHVTVDIIDINGCLQRKTIEITEPAAEVSGAISGAGTICAGSTTDITFTLHGNGSSFDVFYTDGTSVFLLSNISSGHVVSVSPTVATAYTLTGIKDLTTECEQRFVSESVEVNVLPKPVAEPDLSSHVICSGGSSNITLALETGMASSWDVTLVSQDEFVSGTPTVGSGLSNDAIASDVFTNLTNVPGQVIYQATPRQSGCTGDPFIITLQVSPDPQLEVINNRPVICSGGSTDIELSSSTSGATVRLISVTSSSLDLIGLPTVGSTYIPGARLLNNLTNPTNVIQTTTYVFEITANECVSTIKDSLTITINPIPEMKSSTYTRTICDGESTNIELTNPNHVDSIYYSWSVAQSEGALGASASSGSSDTTIIDQRLFNSTGSPATATYTVTPLAKGCQGVSSDIIVIINPIPVVTTTGNEILCSAETSNIELSNPNNVDGVTYLWEVTDNVNEVSGATNGAGNVINQSLFVNYNKPPGMVTYNITPLAYGCYGLPREVIVTVNPQPRVFAGFDSEVCANEGVITLTASVQGSATYGTWSGGNNATGFSDNTVTDGQVVEYVFDEVDSLAGFVTFSLVSDDPDGDGSCRAINDNVTVIINDLPAVTFSGLPDSTGENSSLIPLTGSPEGGIFSGVGISGNLFDPKDATVGLQNVITYTYTSEKGCTNSVTSSVFINGITPIDVGNAVIRICLSDRPDVLEANPSGGIWSGSGVINTETSSYEFDPSVAGVGTFPLTYTYTNTGGAISTAQITYEVIPSPVVNFTNLSSCNDESIVFQDQSTIDNTIFPLSTINKWEWIFYNESNVIVGASEERNPAVMFGSPGKKRVLLTVTSQTNGGECAATHEKSVEIGSVPEAAFGWSGICNGDFTAFADESVLEVGVLNNIAWDFGDGNRISGNPSSDVYRVHDNKAETRGSFATPEHKYDEVGSYKVIMTVKTDKGCEKQYVREVDILPNAVDAGFPYIANFDSGDANWAEEVALVAEAGATSKNSWIYNSQGAGSITPKYEGDGFWWTGGNDGSYYDNEQSWVYGPCFNFSALERPMIGMKIISKTDSLSDGAVLQYSLNGGTSWENIGLLAEEGGVNWYNSNAISAKPGDQSFGYGWTGSVSDPLQNAGWIEVKHNLNKLKGEPSVLIRMAFGSNESNPKKAYSGFAFDDVYVGERTRTVLLEHFTDSKVTNSLSADAHIRALEQSQRAAFGAVDFVTIQYHLNDSGLDPLNKDNPDDPSARSLYYGVGQAPVSVIDGGYGTSSGNPFEIETTDIDRASLSDPLFDIEINIPTTNAIDKLATDVAFTALTDLNSQVRFHVVIVEDSVLVDGTYHRNVMKKIFSGGESQRVNSWQKGQKQSVTTEWVVDVPIYDPTRLYIVAFVQDVVSGEIYAAQLRKGPVKEETLVTAIESDTYEQATEIVVYPNPAAQVVNFGLQKIPLDAYQWKVVDQRGITIKEGNIDFNPLGQYQANLAGIRDGSYYIIIASRQKPLVRKKLTVINNR